MKSLNYHFENKVSKEIVEKVFITNISGVFQSSRAFQNHKVNSIVWFDDILDLGSFENCFFFSSQPILIFLIWKTNYWKNLRFRREFLPHLCHDMLITNLTPRDIAKLISQGTKITTFYFTLWKFHICSGFVLLSIYLWEENHSLHYFLHNSFNTLN